MVDKINANYIPVGKKPILVRHLALTLRKLYTRDEFLGGVLVGASKITKHKTSISA